MGNVIDVQGGLILMALTLVGALVLVARIRGRRLLTASSFAWVCFMLYLSIVLAMAFFPLPITSSVISSRREMSMEGFGQQNNFELFKIFTEVDRWSVQRQIVGNVLLSIPFAVFISILGSFRTITGRVLTVLAFPLGIEVSQLLISEAFGYGYRSFDVDDLALNFVGGLAGLILGKVVNHFFESLDSGPEPSQAVGST